MDETRSYYERWTHFDRVIAADLHVGDIYCIYPDTLYLVTQIELTHGQIFLHTLHDDKRYTFVHDLVRGTQLYRLRCT